MNSVEQLALGVTLTIHVALGAAGAIMISNALLTIPKQFHVLGKGWSFILCVPVVNWIGAFVVPVTAVKSFENYSKATRAVPFRRSEYGLAFAFGTCFLVLSAMFDVNLGLAVSLVILGVLSRRLRGYVQNAAR